MGFSTLLVAAVWLLEIMSPGVMADSPKYVCKTGTNQAIGLVHSDNTYSAIGEGSYKPDGNCRCDTYNSFSCSVWPVKHKIPSQTSLFCSPQQECPSSSRTYVPPPSTNGKTLVCRGESIMGYLDAGGGFSPTSNAAGTGSCKCEGRNFSCNKLALPFGYTTDEYLKYWQCSNTNQCPKARIA